MVWLAMSYFLPAFSLLLTIRNDLTFVSHQGHTRLQIILQISLDSNQFETQGPKLQQKIINL